MDNGYSSNIYMVLDSCIGNLDFPNGYGVGFTHYSAQLFFEISLQSQIGPMAVVPRAA